MPDDEIARLMGQNAALQEKAQALVDQALQRGGKDNVTVVLTRLSLKKPEQS